MDKYVFGITGATGAGKSTISDIFRKLGVFIVDADKTAKFVVSYDENCIAELKSHFGCEIFNSDNVLNRKKLAKIVFTDANKLKLLNKITHKYIKNQIDKEISESESEIAAIDGAVIIGSPVMELCDKLVVVTADNKTRKKRIMLRDGIDEQMAQERINSQMTNSEYEKYADFIIINNDDNVGLEECVEQLYIKIKNISKAEDEAFPSTKKTQ